MQNIEECLANLKFPEPASVETPAEAVVEPVAVTESQAEVAPVAAVEEVVAVAAEPIASGEEGPVAEKAASAKKESKKAIEEEDDEHAKDGVSLDELFQMKPEIFQTAAGEEDESGDKKKGKKGKKKSVELEFDEERGEVVGRKKHKRGDGDLGEDW
jgi:hypothetical protein